MHRNPARQNLAPVFCFPSLTVVAPRHSVPTVHFSGLHCDLSAAIGLSNIFVFCHKRWAKWFLSTAYLCTISTRAATNDYFDNQLFGQLFFRFNQIKKNISFFYFIDKKDTIPHSVQCLSNKRANWMIHLQYLTIRPRIIIKRKHKYFRNLSR